MSPRRRRPRWLTLGLGILAGAVLGGILFGVVFRSSDGVSEDAIRSELRVEVLNGCGLTGAAGRAASKLRRAGFRVESTGAADHYHYVHDVVIVRAGDRAEVERLAGVLRDAVLVEQRIPGYAFDVTVIAGRAHHLVESN